MTELPQDVKDYFPYASVRPFQDMFIKTVFNAVDLIPQLEDFIKELGGIGGQDFKITVKDPCQVLLHGGPPKLKRQPATR